jgi:transposase InsO family protein
VHAELRLGMGVQVGRKRVARLLRMVGRRGIAHRHKRRHRPEPAVHQDLVQRRFTANGPDRLWCTDITEHPTTGGKVYCCAVLDVFSRQVVGWSIADHVRSDLVVDALQMATWRRRPTAGTIVHSDRGSQYTSWVFGHRLRTAGLLGSMGRVASSVDNSMIESFWSTLQRELLDTRRWDNSQQLGSAIFEGSRPRTTPADGTPRSACSPPSNTSTSTNSAGNIPFTQPPKERHDHHATHVRETGSGSRHNGETRSAREPPTPDPAAIRQRRTCIHFPAKRPPPR